MTSPDLQTNSTEVCLADFEAAARERISHLAWEYISGGASDEVTVRWNQEAFEKIRLRPRVLVDVSAIDTRINLFGEELPFPILLAPTAYHRLIHPDGEIATARGANRAGATYVISMMATTSVEEIAAETSKPLWFQLYVQPDRDFTRDLVQRVEEAGVKALCITVDTPVIGTRNREVRNHFALPPELGRPNLRGLKITDETTHRPREGEIYSSLFDPKFTWRGVEWLCSIARVPVLLKGVLNPDDGEIATTSGAAGIIVSNHGGRNLDTVPATIDVLPEVVDRVAGRMPVLLDGGIRRGTDVLKAIALGANGVMIGRPYLYGLGAAGAEGVARVINILRNEFEMAMALCGKTSIAEVNSSVLWDKK